MLANSKLKKLALCLFCMAACLGGGAASAAESEEKMRDVRELEAVVVSASGVEQKITEAPASITVITQEDLQRKPYITLLDALKSIEGVDVGATNDKSGQGTIQIRGMGGDYTLVLINGKRQNDNGDLYPNNFNGHQFAYLPPLASVERIEVIRGPMSTLYGSDAMGGVINIITKKHTDEWHGSTSFSRTFQENPEFGDTWASDVNLSGPLWRDKLSMSLHGSYYDRAASNPTLASSTDPDGKVHYPELGFGSGGKTMDNQNWTAGTQLTFTPVENQDVIFTYDIYRQKVDNTEAQMGTVDSWDTIFKNQRVGYDEYQRYERDSWSLTHKGRWGMGNTSFGLSYVDSNNLGRSLPLSVAERTLMNKVKNTATTAGLPGGWSDRSSSAKLDWLLNDPSSILTADEKSLLQNMMPRKRRTLESEQYIFDGKYDVVLGKHALVAGVQYIDGQMTDGVFGLNDDNYSAGKTQDEEMFAVFAEDSWNMFSGFTLTGGARFDHHSEFGGNVSPRLYAVYNFVPAWTVKGGVSTGYKTPKTTDLAEGVTGFGGQGTIPWLGNPDLKPEKSVNYELALYFDHPDGHGINVTAFYSDFKNKIESVSGIMTSGTAWDSIITTGFSQKQNVRRAEIRGLEVAGKVLLPFDLTFKANYTLTDSKVKGDDDSKEGKPLYNTARHMANLSLNWAPTAALDLFFESELRSKRYRGSANQYTGSEYYKPYNLHNIGISYRFTDYFTATGRVDNLFDKDFTTYDSYFSGSTGNYTLRRIADYNITSPGRSFWVGINCTF